MTPTDKCPRWPTCDGRCGDFPHDRRVRIVPLGPRALRRIERQRTQVQGTAKRSRYVTSGRPGLTRPAVWDNIRLYGGRTAADNGPTDQKGN